MSYDFGPLGGKLELLWEAQATAQVFIFLYFIFFALM